MTLKCHAKFEEILTSGLENGIRNSLHFWSKYIMVELRKYRWVMFDGTQDWYKNLKENWLVLSKMTSGILTQALESLKNLYFKRGATWNHLKTAETT